KPAGLPRRSERCINCVELPVDAWSDDEPVISADGVAMQLRVELNRGFLDLVAPLHALDQLFGAERDQHADDDNADLADELTPAVQRLGQVKMHGSPPRRRRLTAIGSGRQQGSRSSVRRPSFAVPSATWRASLRPCRASGGTGGR